MVDFSTRDKERREKLEEMRLHDEEQSVMSIARQLGFRYIDLSAIPIMTDALSILSEKEAKDGQMVVFAKKNKDIDVAIKNPANPIMKENIKKLKENYNIRSYFLISQKSLKKALDRYNDVSKSEVTEDGVIEISYDVGNSDDEYSISELKTLGEFKKRLELELESKKSHQTFRILNIILYSAYTLGASDIHIEPEEHHTRLRFRIDGILMDIITIKNKIYQRLLSRIKLTAGLKINMRENSQDGRFSIRLKDSYIEIRTSTLPDTYGESIVMRLLDPKAISVDLEDLGMLPYFYEIMSREIKRPNGMILNTGPTGSGKSTTLFAFLRKVKTPEIKIITIEDPIEYHVEGLVQTQVNKEKGYTFLSGLRAALRQDPDVIMVGEIRDHETASVAANSALTGHLVLSTIHTNSAAGTFARLIDLKVNPKIISTAVSVIIAQRLVRKLCKYCKVEMDYSDKVDIFNRNRIYEIFNEIENKEKYIDNPNEDKKIYKAVGCDKCNGTGYKGRIAVFEAILMDEKIEKILDKDPSEREIKRVAKSQGILSLKEDGVVKILTGITSFSELARVIDLNREI